MQTEINVRSQPADSFFCSLEHVLAKTTGTMKNNPLSNPFSSNQSLVGLDLYTSLIHSPGSPSREPDRDRDRVREMQEQKSH